MNKFQLDNIPKICTRHKTECPAYREVSWSEGEFGICLFSVCVGINNPENNWSIFDFESYLRPKDKFYIKYLKQDKKN